MSNYINGILVVEGSNDASLISSIVDCEIVVTNGFELDNQTVNYLKTQSKYKTIYVLTDPDLAGEQIRNKLHQNIPNVVDVYVDINKCNKHNKHGVAECTIEEINRALSPYFSQKPDILYEISIMDLYKLKLIGDGSEKNRIKITTKLNLGKCNGKKLLERLNSLGINVETIEKILEA